MTMPDTPRRAGPFIGNGTATAFPFTFKIFSDTDINVYRVETATGEIDDLTLGVDYSVTMNSDQGTSPGGTVNYPLTGSPLAATHRLVVVGAVPYTQPARLPPGGAFRAEVIERSLDVLTVLVQQLREVLGRTLQIPPAFGDVSTVLPAAVDGALLGWGPDGLRNFPPNELGDFVAPTSTAEISHTPAAGGAPAVWTTKDKLDRTVRSVFDFMSGSKRQSVAAGDLAVDVTSELQNAFSSGERVFMEPGKYRADGAITTSTPPRVFGSGYLTEIRSGVTTGAAITFDNAPGSYDPGLFLTNLVVVGPGAGVGSATGVVLKGSVWANSIVDNLLVTGMGGNGIDFSDCLTMTARCVRAQGNGGIGILARKSNGIVMLYPSAESNGNHGIVLHEDGGSAADSTGFTLLAPHVEENEGHGVYLRGRQGGTITGGWLQVKGTAGSTRGAIYAENSSILQVFGAIVTTGGDITNLAGVYADGTQQSEFHIMARGFAAGRDVVANASSSRCRFTGSGGGLQGGLSTTNTSSTGNHEEDWAGRGGNYGPVSTANFHSWCVPAGERLALDANGLRLVGHSTTTTAPGAGGAGALPATPTGYVTVNINGTARKIAYY